ELRHGPEHAAVGVARQPGGRAVEYIIELLENSARVLVEFVNVDRIRPPEMAVQERDIEQVERLVGQNGSENVAGRRIDLVNLVCSEEGTVVVPEERPVEGHVLAERVGDIAGGEVDRRLESAGLRIGLVNEQREALLPFLAKQGARFSDGAQNSVRAIERLGAVEPAIAAAIEVGILGDDEAVRLAPTAGS